MKSTELTFDYSVPAERLYQLFTDGQFLAAQLEASGGKEVAVLERDANEDAARVVWRQRTQVEVPSFAKSIVLATNKVTETDVWRADGDDYNGEWSAEVSGVPAVTSGSMRITPTEDGCRYTFVGTVRIKVPLIGGKLEGLGIDQMEGEIQRKDAYTRAHLAESA